MKNRLIIPWSALTALFFVLAAFITGVEAQTVPPYWVPLQKTSMHLQLTGTVNQQANTEMFVIDLFDTSADIVAALHARGSKVVCYMSAGSWENWRPDAGLFHESVLGSTLSGWPDERWLDIRRLDILGPIMTARMDLCKAKGFDGIDPDNVDGYTNEPGFPLTYEDQLAYNIFLANEAHSRGLSIGLKNDLNQIPDLVPYFDWALNEQCYQYRECPMLLPFVEAGKAVFEVEYKGSLKKFCSQAETFGFNAMKKKLSLGAWTKPCP